MPAEPAFDELPSDYLPGRTADHLRAHAARSALDAELAALVWLLVERGVPLVVGSPDRAAAEDLRAAFMAAVIERQPGRDSLAGGVVVAASLESVLSRLGASSELPDEARDLGLVLIVSDARVTSRTTSGRSSATPPATSSAGRRPSSAPATSAASWITSSGP